MFLLRLWVGFLIYLRKESVAKRINIYLFYYDSHECFASAHFIKFLWFFIIIINSIIVLFKSKNLIII